MKIHRGCLDPVAGDMDSATMWPRQIHQLIKDAAAHDHLGDQDDADVVVDLVLGEDGGYDDDCDEDDADDVVDLGLGEFNQAVGLTSEACY